MPCRISEPFGGWGAAVQTPTPVSPALVHTTCSDGLVRFPFHHFLSRGALGGHCHRLAVVGAGPGVGPEEAVGARPPVWTEASCCGVLDFPAFSRRGRSVQKARRVFSAKQCGARSPSRAERKWVQPCPPKPGLGRDLAFAALQACPLRGSRPPRGRLSLRSTGVIKVPCGQRRPTVRPRGP